MSIDFEKNNWGWQFYILRKQIGEWVEYQLSQFENIIPNVPRGWRFSQWFLQALTIGFWVIVGLFVLWVIWRLWKEFNPYLFNWLNEVQNPNNTSVKMNQNISAVALLSRAQELASQGNYREGCRCLYLALLQFLHEKGSLPHKVSRTDGEYLQILKLSMSPMQPYETLLTTHEQICFDEMEVVPENYNQCRQAYREIAQE